MKNIKLILFAVISAFLVVCAANLSAQVDGTYKGKTPKTPEEKARIATDRMRMNLNLTDEQYSKIYNLYLDRFKSKQEKKNDAKKNKEEKKSENREFIKNLKSILTEEQYNKLKENKKELMKKNKEKKNKEKSGEKVND